MCRADAVKQELLFGCGPHLHPLGAGCLPGGAVQEERVVQHVGIVDSGMSIELRQKVIVCGGVLRWWELFSWSCTLPLCSSLCHLPVPYDMNLSKQGTESPAVCVEGADTLLWRKSLIRQTPISTDTLPPFSADQQASNPCCIHGSAAATSKAALMAMAAAWLRLRDSCRRPMGS